MAIQQLDSYSENITKINSNYNYMKNDQMNVVFKVFDWLLIVCLSFFKADFEQTNEMK